MMPVAAMPGGTTTSAPSPRSSRKQAVQGIPDPSKARSRLLYSSSRMNMRTSSSRSGRVNSAMSTANKAHTCPPVGGARVLPTGRVTPRPNMRRVRWHGTLTWIFTTGGQGRVLSWFVRPTLHDTAVLPAQRERMQRDNYATDNSQCSPCQPARCISPLGFIAQSGYFMRPDGNLFELLTARREAQREFQLSVQQKLREYYSSNLLRTLHRKILNKLHHPGLHMRINGLAGRISQQVTPQSGRSDCTLIPVISYPLVGCTPYWNDSGRRL